MNTKKYGAKIASCAVSLFMVSVAPVAATTVNLELDFGAVSVPAFGSTETSIDFTDVADGVNARLTTLNTFVSANANNNGAVEDDLRVNAQIGQTAELSLTIFDANVGNGFDQEFTASEGFTWSLVFYDVDGFDPSFDSVLLRTAGVVTQDANSLLSFTDTADGLLVDGNLNEFIGNGVPNGGNIQTQNGVDSLNAEQQAAAFGYTITNQSTVFFDYIVDRETENRTSGRNLLVDGGSLLASFDNPVEVGVSPVPLPAGAWFLLTGLGGVVAASRRKKAA